jgi:hypothetical protein
MGFYWFTLGALAVWRITHLLAVEDGPFDLMVRLRRRAGAGFWGNLLDCFYCVSVWVSVPFAYGLGANWKERALLWPALSGAAILLERLTKPATKPNASYFEDEERDDAVLWTKEEPGRGSSAKRN